MPTPSPRPLASQPVVEVVLSSSHEAAQVVNDVCLRPLGPTTSTTLLGVVINGLWAMSLEAVEHCEGDQLQVLRSWLHLDDFVALDPNLSNIVARSPFRVCSLVPRQRRGKSAGTFAASSKSLPVSICASAANSSWMR